FVYTSDRDLGQTKPYENIAVNQWNCYNGIHIYYSSPQNQNKENLNKQIYDVSPNFIYLNSMFSKHFSIDVLHTQKNFSNIKYVLAPRGMLKPSAIQYKFLKKKLYLIYGNTLGLFKNVQFHATDKVEVGDIKKNIKTLLRIQEIGNCPSKPSLKNEVLDKKSNYLNLIFIGRIHPIKNLHLALQALQNVKENINFTIVGVLEDADYWETCKSLIKELKSNIIVSFLKELEPHLLQKLIKENHVLILPTKGENFGHSIYECLCFGKPVIISNQTPWKNLEANKAGFDISLNNISSFNEAINFFAQKNQDEYNNWSNGAYKVANDYYNNNDITTKYLSLFNINSN
ncbi:MAG: glycosyltransferase, partial [Chitinophagaceae bacterium]